MGLYTAALHPVDLNTSSPTAWILFHALVFTTLALDLGVFHRRTREISVKQALGWTAVWISLALLFNLGIFATQGQEPALKWLTGYVVEKSLSVDNIFVFVLIFSYFRVPPAYQHRVLYWGILGALVMRAGLIAFGVSLVNAFSWTLYLFGAFLIYSGVKFAFQDEDGVHPERNPLFQAARRYLRVTPGYEGSSFFVRLRGRLYATPLFLVLLVVESTDLIFAVDSIPAVLAITTDPFTVYTSNILAIMGLRSLYFALAGSMDTFHYLKYGLSLILIFIGVKMLLEHLYPLPIEWALGFILLTLTLSVALSLLFPARPDSEAEGAQGDPS